ncbi:hypothetical protein A5649_20880 [Mycolicibacter heraklionensis]|uniref:Uncharacterized protein n=1 Tax=Mycolicibacter heraklionensis TaxID=512402 RepID=A0AA91IYG3_9MYCO|nr:hypothetical protein [Mycolicibacter heraklionensis]OBK86306.1 hypothetical protein A5649_20880 [Mycolicibacter heraklionensis]
MEPGNLEARVAALETQVRDLDGRVRGSERDAAAARVLAGAADRDVSEIRDELRDFRRATIASFNALCEDMNDRFTQVNNGFAEMRGRFDATAAGQQHIVELIQGLIGEQGGNR